MTKWVDAAQLDLAEVVRPGDALLWGQACAEPQTLVEALVEQRAAFSGASVFLGVNYSGVIKPEHADHLRFAAYCGAGHNRDLARAGVLDILPLPYSQLAGLLRSRRLRADVVMLQLSPPNARGEYSLGLAAEYLVPALEACRTLVVEVNEEVPWTHSDRLLRERDFTLAVRSTRPPAVMPAPPPGELERAIAAHAAAYVPDGAALELGLGNLPEALLGALHGHRELGVHSGAIGDGVAELMRRGVITNARKALDPGRSVTGVLFGTHVLHRFAHGNRALRLASVEHTHGAAALGQLENFVAVNSAVEVDLTGQVNGEVANGRYVGAVGGALDFVRAANQSPGGVSLTLLPSSVGGKASRIVARLSGPVSTPRGEAGVIVTEHGAADLRGLSLVQRVPRMLAIAHPALRAGLEREAHALGLLR